MSKMKFKLNSAGVKELLKGQAMRDILTEHARGVVSRAGKGYSADIYVGKNRANAMVKAETYQAKSDNKKNNTLLKALR